MKLLAFFALGYLARPLGGIIFGNQGDRIGRKPIFLFSILLMAFSTLIIGLLPAYHSIGISATIGLIFLRILQGMAFGAEIPGTVTFLVEHTQHYHRGRHIGFALSSISLGASLGSGIIFILSQNLSAVQMVNYGWRIPFLLGGSLALVGFFIRRKLQETPLFLAYQNNNLKTNHKTNHQQPIVYLLQHYPRLIFLGISISLLSACFIVFFYFFAEFFTTVLSLSFWQCIFVCVTWVYLVSAHSTAIWMAVR